MITEFDERVAALRRVLKEDGADYCLLSALDEQLLESPGAYWGGIRWLCGFTGSNSTALITQDDFVLWTDGRYIQQAQRQIGLSHYKVYDMLRASDVQLEEYLTRAMASGGKSAYSVVFDGRTFSSFQIEEIRKTLSAAMERTDIRMNGEADYLDFVWKDRPQRSRNNICDFELKYAGVDRREKLDLIRSDMKRRGADAYFVSSADSVAWVTNLRGDAYPIYPLFYAYLLITAGEATIFTDSAVPSTLADKLREDGFALEHLNELPGKFAMLPDGCILYFDPQATPNRVESLIPEKISIERGPDLTELRKAVKNLVEINNIRSANIDEGVALCRLQMKLEEMLDAGLTPAEFELGCELERLRKQSENYLQPGNLPIVAYMANAALPHYRPTAITTDIVRGVGLLLYDVVGHYLTGTTDISRTIPAGAVTDIMREDYTIVLKSLIALSSYRFSPDEACADLDQVSRDAMQRYGRDYMHGTGHGIGYCLCVHEGPYLVGKRRKRTGNLTAELPLPVGALISDEPGIYRGGEYGIRLENDLVVHEDDDGNRYFETATRCPFDLGMILPEMLEEAELAWLNSYHEGVYRDLSPHMTETERRWLREKTHRIERNA